MSKIMKICPALHFLLCNIRWLNRKDFCGWHIKLTMGDGGGDITVLRLYPMKSEALITVKGEVLIERQINQIKSGMIDNRSSGIRKSSLNICAANTGHSA